MNEPDARFSPLGTGRPKSTAEDRELLLAQQLSALEQTGDDGLPASLFDQLSPTERLQFAQACQGLGMVKQAASDSVKNSEQATPRLRSNDEVTDVPVAVGEQIPDRIGRFEIEKELGRGGFGVVLLARDPRLDRQVALKIPHANGLINPELQKRFNREARAAGVLSHPGIVPIFETDRIGPIHYIAYEYVVGMTLGEWLSECGTAPAKTAAEVLIALSEAVQYAHSRGIIHRDLKPANVLIETTEPPNGATLKTVRLKITDFGLASLASESENLTREGVLVGTPAYMSPEQANSPSNVDRASDIYSLGAILFHLVTGRPPFQGDHHLATLKAIAESPPPSPHRLNPQVPRDLLVICLKCLEKQPDQRYESCQELADDLLAFLEGRAVSARGTGPLGRLVRWSQRNLLLSASLFGLMLALLVGAVSSTIQWRRAEIARSKADHQSKIAEAKSDEALSQARMTRNAIDQLYRSIADEPAIHEQGMESFRLRLAESAQQYYQQLSQSRPADHEVLSEYVDTLRSLALMLQMTGKMQDAIVLWREASEIVQHHFPKDLLRWVALRSKLSENLIFTGAVKEGVQVANELVNRLQHELQHVQLEPAAFEKTVKQLIVQLINAAQNQLRANKFADAENAIQQAIGFANLLTGKTPAEWPAGRIWARVLRCQAEVANSQDKWEIVEKAAPRGIQLYEQLLRDPRRVSEALSSLSSLHQYLANSRRLQKDFVQAFAEHELSGKYLEQLLERHPEVGGLWFNWSNHISCYSRTMIEAQSIDSAHQLLADHLPKLQQQQQDYPQLLWLLKTSEMECRELMAQTLVHRNEFDQALAELNVAVSICEQDVQYQQSGMRAPTQLGRLFLEKAEVYFKQKDYENAETWINRSLATLKPIVDSADESRAEQDRAEQDPAPAKLLERARSLKTRILDPPTDRSFHDGDAAHE